MIPSQTSRLCRKCLNISWLVRPPEMNQREFFQTAQESIKQPKWVLSHGCFPLNADLDFQGLRLSHGPQGMTDWFGNAFFTEVRSRCRLWYKNTFKNHSKVQQICAHLFTRNKTPNDLKAVQGRVRQKTGKHF